MSETTTPSSTAAHAPHAPSYGVATDYEYSAEHKRQRVTLWSGPFASQYEGEAYTRPNGWTLHPAAADPGESVKVSAPNVRNDRTHEVVDAALSEALEAWYVRKGYRTATGDTAEAGAL